MFKQSICEKKHLDFFFFKNKVNKLLKTALIENEAKVLVQAPGICLVTTIISNGICDKIVIDWTFERDEPPHPPDKQN